MEHISGLASSFLQLSYFSLCGCSNVSCHLTHLQSPFTYIMPAGPPGSPLRSVRELSFPTWQVRDKLHRSDQSEVMKLEPGAQLTLSLVLFGEITDRVLSHNTWNIPFVATNHSIRSMAFFW